MEIIVVWGKASDTFSRSVSQTILEIEIWRIFSLSIEHKQQKYSQVISNIAQLPKLHFLDETETTENDSNITLKVEIPPFLHMCNQKWFKTQA